MNHREQNGKKRIHLISLMMGVELCFLIRNKKKKSNIIWFKIAHSYPSENTIQGIVFDSAKTISKKSKYNHLPWTFSSITNAQIPPINSLGVIIDQKLNWICSRNNVTMNGRSEVRYPVMSDSPIDSHKPFNHLQYL